MTIAIAPGSEPSDDQSPSPGDSTPMRTVAATDRLEYLDLSLVDPPELDFREKRDEAHIERLVNTLREGRDLNPIYVKRVLDRFRVVTGETRRQAYAIAGRGTIPARVTETELSRLEEMLDAYCENEHTQKFGRPQRGKLALAIIRESGLPQSAVAQRLGRSRGQLSKDISVYEDASEHVKELLASGKLFGTFGEKLAAIPDHTVQDEMADKAIKFRWKRPRLQKEIAEVLGKPVGRAPRKKSYQDADGFSMKYPANWTLKQTEDAFKKALKKFARDDSGGPGSPQTMA